MPDFDINPGAYYRENFLVSYNLKEVLEDKSSLPVDFRKNSRGEYSVNIVCEQQGENHQRPRLYTIIPSKLFGIFPFLYLCLSQRKEK